jgi:transposase
VKEAVVEWKRQQREVFVPLVYPAGDLAEVDFFEVLLDLSGKREKAWMFVMRLMHSGRDFACLYRRQDQTSFLDGHVRAFEHFGCVPQRIAYDNLKAAVTRSRSWAAVARCAIHASASVRGRSTIGTTCASLPASPKRCVR